MVGQAPADPSAAFDERFSAEDRTQPLFTHPDIQSLIASLPPLAPPADALAADTESETPTAESTASLPAQEPNPEIAATSPGPEMPLPELPPPPAPAEVTLPSKEELAAASPETPSPSSTATEAKPAENTPQTLAPTPTHAQERVEKRPKPKNPTRKTAHVKPPAVAQNHPATTGSLADCRTGTSCASQQQQTFATLFGFITGALLGGPIGAIAGATIGAAATAPDARQAPRPDPARR